MLPGGVLSARGIKTATVAPRAKRTCRRAKFVNRSPHVRFTEYRPEGDKIRRKRESVVREGWALSTVPERVSNQCVFRVKKMGR